MSERRVVVVGGGLAGIASALDSASAGAHVTLLEARPRLGGAAYSFQRGGLVVDNGQHVFLRCCTAYRELLGRLGALDLVALQSRLDILVLAPGEAAARLRRRRLPAPLHLAGSLARYRFLRPAERLAAARAMAALRRVDPDDEGADARSFGEWLREQGQGPAAIETLWSLIGRPTLNLDPEEASLAQAAQVFRVGLLEAPDAGDVGYARVPLSEIHDVAARRGLERAGVEVRLGTSASSIRPSGAGFELEVGEAAALHADAVVLAVPHERVATLLPDEAAVDGDRLGGLGRSPIVNLHVVYDRRVLDAPFAAATRTPVQWLFDRSAGAGLGAGQYLATSLSAADEEASMSGEELRDLYLPALAALLPAARSARVEEFFVTREHAATFRGAPGTRALRPGPRTALPGLALAGAWTDTGWPATMESAVRSGRAAAEVVVEELSLRPGRS